MYIGNMTETGTQRVQTMHTRRLDGHRYTDGSDSAYYTRRLDGNRYIEDSDNAY